MTLKEKWIQSAVSTFIALTATHAAISASANSPTTTSEKCYGVSKAGYGSNRLNTSINLRRDF